jgi:hypothetical protein
MENLILKVDKGFDYFLQSQINKMNQTNQTNQTLQLDKGYNVYIKNKKCVKKLD